MALIRMPAGAILSSKDVRQAWFWEQGAALGEGLVDQPILTAAEHTLRLELYVPSKSNSVIGPEALRIANELDKAGVDVIWTRKNRSCA